MNLLPLPLILCVITLFSGASAAGPDKHSNPFDDSQWAPSDAEIASITKKDLMMLQAAIQMYSGESKKSGDAPITFNQVKAYLRSDSRLYRSLGKDILGNAYVFSTVQAGAAISPVTIHELNKIPKEFWTSCRLK